MEENKIVLELEPSLDADKADAAIATLPKEDREAYLQNVNLSDEEKKTVADFVDKIDIKNSGIILQYGAAAQKRVADFSDSALKGVKTKDLGDVGTMLAGLITELKGFSAGTEEKKGLFGRIKEKITDVAKLKAKYDSAEANVNKITAALETHSDQLQKDIIMLDKMYESNLTYFKELTMYILAGKEKLDKERKTTLIELEEKAKKSGLTEDAQAAKDFDDLCNRFDKKISDLELTRTISMQMAPQIRLVQNGDTLMVEKIQSTINNTIPLWKNQMVIALGMAHSQSAMEAERKVTDLTNELIKKNAESLKAGSIEIAKESERGIVDMETIKYTNRQLIETLDEVVKIQDEGRAKRREAESELGQIEAELKAKLLDIRH
ncbi:MAG: toxic anion resistance protein [Candidatus Alectryocaccobium sp.]|nr:toxic anion resistance protein [Candidatus Alectryocaccobium sp.]